MRKERELAPLQWGDPMNATLRVAIYARKSTATEGKSHSCEEQIERCLQDAKSFGFAEANIVVFEEPEGQKGDWYWDDGRGRHDGPCRPELSKLMRLVESGDIDVVMVYKADRFYRDNGVADALLKRFRELGVRLIAQGRDVEVHSARGLYQAAVDGAAARQWRDQISEDIRRDHRFKAERGMFSRNPSCLGFRSKGRGTQAVDPIPDELEIVRRVFGLFVHGENGEGPLGITAIANRFMDEGVRVAVSAKNHRVKHPDKVHTSQIRTILTNCMYAGRWRHLGREFETERLLVPGFDGELETVVPLALYEAAQRKLERSTVPGRKGLGLAHLLTSIAVCGECGRPLRTQQRKRGDGTVRLQFICSHLRGDRPCSRKGTRAIQVELVDSWVFEHLSPLLWAQLKQLESSTGRDGLLEKKTALERKLAEQRERESTELVRLSTVLDSVQLAGVATELREERIALEANLADVSRQIATPNQPDASELLDLRDLPLAKAKELIRRSLLWLAMTHRGVVAMTTWGTYCAAPFVEAPKGYKTQESKRRIAPVCPVASLGCASWFVNPDEFVRGQREYQPARMRNLADHEVVHTLWREAA
ncbi:MAG: recombinase family protein [Fimbriimonadaceae bacterium]|nr:recombinase family protein [Fimbriimonadaceae bacterium]QOJ10595.1 MAG: recombinase family protein [Chthonomonadaceae bacterium]